MQVYRHIDMLAHANLACVLGHGLYPWCMLDAELRELALQLVQLDPTLDDGLALVASEPWHFAAWVAREEFLVRTMLGPLAPRRRRRRRVAKKIFRRIGRLRYRKAL